jgi:8-oxo-dGTP diphosphatase
MMSDLPVKDGCWGLGEDEAAQNNAAGELPQVLVVAAALVDVDNRILLARRPAGKSMAGLWEFPGGKVGADETPEAALIRELAEELGIETRNSCLAPFTFASHVYDDFRLLMPLYIIRTWQGAPQSLEGQDLKWVRPKNLTDYPMPPADVPLVALLRDYL